MSGGQVFLLSSLRKHVKDGESLRVPSGQILISL